MSRVERILVSNDDGINATGLAVLERVARKFSDDVWVIAPEAEQSGAGHSLTITKPLRVRKLADKRYAIDGTPTDCVMMAVNKLMLDHKPTLILSGVNRGGNLAEDVTYSGTVSVAIEGTLAGIPSVAFSQCVDLDRSAPWETAETHAPVVLEKLLAAGWPAGVLMNVNFPAMPAGEVKGIKITAQGRREMGSSNVEERIDPRGFRYYWFGLGREIGVPGQESDLNSVRDGCISVTPLHLDLTHHATRAALSEAITCDFCK